ncbi:MAG: ATPase [candidate division Zixibacteria bacterium 4484_95]|nr:MAG: ATPase [candidate division Zixibacteria bacterium 4484_95]
MATIFNYQSQDAIGVVESVDTSSVIIKVEKDDILKQIQVNQLVVLRSSKAGQHLIGIIDKITRTIHVLDEEQQLNQIQNIIRVKLIGTHLDKYGIKENIFKRTLETIPEIDAECFILRGETLTSFMRAISQLVSQAVNPLNLGHYTLDEEAEAWLDGNKLFQRHSVIVGSTGSGKSWTVANLLENIAKLPSANAIVFDLHGEYSPLNDNGFTHFKIAGPNDTPDLNNIIFLPYWLLTYEEMLSLLLDRSDTNAPNQAMAFSREVINLKRHYLNEKDKEEVLGNFTIDSPIPFDIKMVISNLNELDKEMVKGSSGRPKQGPMHGKLTRFLQRLQAKINDKRLNFLFNENEILFKYEWLEEFCKSLMNSSSLNDKKGIKIINFSEVPSDILPLITGLVARIIFTVQQWIDYKDRHPIALFCDEAHLYIPERVSSSIEEVGLNVFQRIAKEGRKYGVGLVVISQRPSEVNKTVLSQSNNFIAMRLTNSEDQNVIRKLLPDSLGNFADLLPILDIGEAVVVGDASLLPSRIRITEPKNKPSSATIDFWDEWSKNSSPDVIKDAVESMRRQSK